MNDLLNPLSVRVPLPSSLPNNPLQHPQHSWASLPRSRTDGFGGSGEARLRLQEEVQNPNQKLVARWLAGTAEVSPRGLRTPPMEMTGNGQRPKLPAAYGGLYNANNVPSLVPPPNGNNSSLTFYDRKDFNLTNRQGQSTLSQPNSPTQYQSNGAVENQGSKRRKSEDANQIVSYLQIPPTINNSKGSLAEFAAQITCLFWFESSFTLHWVEESKITPTPTTPLVTEAIPTMGFRKWVTTMLSTTQVTQNVILLALMFIYRLKKLNPTVKGRPGSEYRLLTVALMLGNKFLDDNTYTNKTWAEVSGISVGEIHIMEVEFLSNMRYTLYSSEKEWHVWHRKLGRFWDYFDIASTSPTPAIQAQILGAPLTLPSPPQSQQSSPPWLTNPSTTGLPQPYQPSPLYLAPPIPSPMARMPQVDLRPSGVKRKHDDTFQEPPAKRYAAAQPYRAATIGPSSSSTIGSTPAPPRLPIPNLSISTSGHPSLHPGSSYSAHLPPPSARSMSTVYPPPTAQPPASSSTSLNPLLHPSNFNHSNSTLPPMNEHIRWPHPTEPSRTTSPTFAQPTQDLHSPSGYPIQRSSPYKPVRQVNTLLVPPPSASLHNPSQHLGYQNMHYQPLGRPASERKTGVVPYMPQDSWGQQQQQQQQGNQHISQWSSTTPQQLPPLPYPGYLPGDGGYGPSRGR